MNVSKIQAILKQNSPTILSGAAVAGVIVTAVLTHKAARKSAHQIEVEETRRSMHNDSEHEPVENEVLDRKEKIKLTWKSYIPAVTAGAATVACIVWANQLGLRRNAALVAAYGILDAGFREYKDQVVELLGEKKHNEVEDAVAVKRMDQNPPTANNTIIVKGGGDVRMYDMWGGRYFRSDIETVRQAVNVLNRDIIGGNMYAELNALYQLLGIPGTDGGDFVGWNVDNLCDVGFTSHLADDGEPCIAMRFTIPPKADFGKCF